MLLLSRPTSRTSRFPVRCRLALASGLALLILAGCDTTEEPVVLFYTETVQFAFTSEAAMMGQTTTLESKDRQGRTLRIDLTEKLRDDGFSKAEVLGAFVESAELELLAPFGIGLDFLDEATLQVEASGASATTVATENDFPSEREAAMDVPHQRGHRESGYCAELWSSLADRSRHAAKRRGL